LAQQDRERQRTVQINRDLCPNSPGDVLNVVKLDRLGRNTRDVLNLVASLRVLEPAIEPAG
jgi:DNA invertase Pin-like site-specific DNA recombinase